MARAIKKQKPFYPTWAMEKDEKERQALLKTMSRTQRRKERVALFKGLSRNHSGDNTYGGVGGGRSFGSKPSTSSYDDAATASLIEDGVLFRPAPTVVRLRTAKQMQEEVARRRPGHKEQDNGFFSSSNGGGGQRGGDTFGSGGNSDSDGRRVGGGGGRRMKSSSADSITVRRRDSGMSDGAPAGGQGIVIEVNHTGGRQVGSGDGVRGQQGSTGGGRPNLIFTPSLLPVGMESVRSCPMSLGGGDHSGSVRWAGGTKSSDDSSQLEGDGGRGGGGGDVPEDMAGTLRDSRTV